MYTQTNVGLAVLCRFWLQCGRSLSRGTACGLSSELYATFTVLTLSSRCHVYHVLQVSPDGLSFVAVIARG